MSEHRLVAEVGTLQWSRLDVQMTHRWPEVHTHLGFHDVGLYVEFAW